MWTPVDMGTWTGVSSPSLSTSFVPILTAQGSSQLLQQLETESDSLCDSSGLAGVGSLKSSALLHGTEGSGAAEPGGHGLQSRGVMASRSTMLISQPNAGEHGEDELCKPRGCSGVTCPKQ